MMPVLTQAQVFVNYQATGSNNGTSWTNAYTELSDAMISSPTQDIWVATGTYFPSPTGAITESFVVTGSMSIYGGFEGNETSLDQRNLADNPTILSGDYNGDDQVTVTTNPLAINFVNTSENANRILIGSGVSGTVIIDGFTFQGGNCTSGGAAILFTTSGLLDLEVSNCRFINNFASGSAAALRFGCAAGNTLNTLVENCDFINNKIQSNTGAKGGCVWTTGNGFINSQYISSTFKQNYSSGRGGAICTDMNVLSAYISCLFDDNDAVSGGAIFENSTQDCTIGNCTFYDNGSNNEASVVYNFGSGDMNVHNSIFNENNDQPLFGSSYLIRNSILDASSFSEIMNDAPGSSNLGGNLFAANPMFVNAAADDFNLSANSPAINTGDNSFAFGANDLTGHIIRIVDGTVDMGALEWFIPMEASVDNATICFGEDFGFAEISASQYPGFTYQWSDSNVSGAMPDNLTPGDNQVTVTNSIGDFVVLEVTLTENAEITTTSSSTPSAGSDGSATVSAAGGTAPFTFSWNTSPMQTEATATGLAPGDYECMVTDASGCEVLVSVTVAQTTAVHDIDQTAEIQVFPNPFTNYLNISVEESMPLDQVRLYDSVGRLVYSGALNNGLDTQLNLVELPAGFYMIELSGSDERYQKKIVK